MYRRGEQEGPRQAAGGALDCCHIIYSRSWCLSSFHQSLISGDSPGWVTDPWRVCGEKAWAPTATVLPVARRAGLFETVSPTVSGPWSVRTERPSREQFDPCLGYHRDWGPGGGRGRFPMSTENHFVLADTGRRLSSPITPPSLLHLARYFC